MLRMEKEEGDRTHSCWRCWLAKFAKSSPRLFLRAAMASDDISGRSWGRLDRAIKFFKAQSEGEGVCRVTGAFAGRSVQEELHIKVEREAR